MVLLEKLSNSNFEKFRELSLERISVENYDKDFFEYYEKEKFFFKIFFKKFVKLFVYNGEIIGYISVSYTHHHVKLHCHHNFL